MRLLYAVEPFVFDTEGNIYRVIAQFRHNLLVRSAGGKVFFADFNIEAPHPIEVDFPLEWC